MNIAGTPVNTPLRLDFVSHRVATSSVTPARSWFDPPNSVQMNPHGAPNRVLVNRNVMIETMIDVT